MHVTIVVCYYSLHTVYTALVSYIHVHVPNCHRQHLLLCVTKCWCHPYMDSTYMYICVEAELLCHFYTYLFHVHVSSCVAK